MLLPLACIGLWIMWGDRARVLVLLGMAGTYALSVLAFYVVARYRLLLVPFLVLFAAVALVRSRSFLQTRSAGQIAVGAAVLGMVAVLCNRPAEPANLMRAITSQNLGAALLEARRPEQAASAFERAIRARRPARPFAEANFQAGCTRWRCCRPTTSPMPRRRAIPIPAPTPIAQSFQAKSEESRPRPERWTGAARRPARCPDSGDRQPSGPRHWGTATP